MTQCESFIGPNGTNDALKVVLNVAEVVLDRQDGELPSLSITV